VKLFPPRPAEKKWQPGSSYLLPASTGSNKNYSRYVTIEKTVQTKNSNFYFNGHTHENQFPHYFPIKRKHKKSTMAIPNSKRRHFCRSDDGIEYDAEFRLEKDVNIARDRTV